MKVQPHAGDKGTDFILTLCLSEATWFRGKIDTQADYFIASGYVSIFMAIPNVLITVALQYSLKSENVMLDASSSILLSQDCFGYARSVVFP